MIVVVAVLGIPHYLSTFTFYFWKDNQHYRRARWQAFFLAPAGLAVLVAVLAFNRIPYILQLAVYFWNAFHVARQSCGILSLYRHRAGVVGPHHKAIANTAIIASNGCLVCWNLAWEPGLYQPLARLTTILPYALWLGCGVVAVLALLRLGLSLWRRWQQGQAASIPEWCFLGTSLLLFHPYLWVRDTSQATTAMLLGHFVQYLGLLWLLHRRKFSGHERSAGPRWLVRLSTHTGTLLLALLASGVVYLVLRRLCMFFSLTMTFDTVLFILVFLHFYLDSLFWAFKDPQVRRSIGPYLTAGFPSPASP
jgi:hypothetical protein